MAAAIRPPIYRRVLETLTAEISGGRLKPGQKIPSEAALVRRFGVSRITVGRAVHELQQLGLVDRVAGSGTYVRDVGGSAGASPLFGLIIPDLGETEIFEPICQGIANAPEAAGCGLLWPHAGAERGSRGSRARDDQALQLCNECIRHRVAGVFFAPLEMTPAAAKTNHRILRLLEEAAIPVVLLDRRPAETSSRRRHDLVGIDNRRAGFVAAEHLLRLGSQRIGFLMYEGQASTARARAAGYREAVGDGLIFELKPERPLVLPPEASPCDGFVCANDRIAGRLMHTLLAMNVRIPQDVRIVGIDDVNYASLLPVPLTTIHQPCHEIGEAALRRLLERLERPRSAARDTLLDCELVVRESCGALSGHSKESLS